MAVNALLRRLVIGMGLAIFLFSIHRGAPVGVLRGSVQPAEAAPAASPRFVAPGGIPLAGARIWILCYPSATSHRVLTELDILTGADGRPESDLPAECAWIAALRRLYAAPDPKPGHGPAYEVFQTSWLAGSRLLLPADGDIVIDPLNRLTLFRIIAALEWRSPPGSPFLDQLHLGLRQASAYLYDLTDGQAAIGSVSLHQGGEAWNRADLRFTAANDYRPAAYVGGIVPAAREYTTLTARKPIFVPAEIYLGRFWDGKDAFDPASGSWDLRDAFRTLGHEWGHYAFFLYDEYQRVAAGGLRVETYCPCADALAGCPPTADASAMSFQYTAAELWHPDHDFPAVPASCVGVDQLTVYGENDWRVLGRWGEIQGFGQGYRIPGDLNPGPSQGLVEDLFGRAPGRRLFLPLVAVPGGAPPPAEELQVSLRILSGAFEAEEFNGFYPEVFLLKPGQGGSRAAILAQGTATGERDALARDLGGLTLFGVDANNLVRISLDRYTTDDHPGGRFIYPGAGGDSLPLDDGEVLELEQVLTGGWEPGLDLVPVLGGDHLGQLTVRLTRTPPGPAPIAQLCTPAAEVRCPEGAAWRMPMVYVGSNRWTAIFSPMGGSRFPNFGYVRVTAPGLGEIMRSFQMAGGVGPAHMPGDAPLRDGAVMVDSPGPIQGRSQVVAMPAAEPRILHAALPSGVVGILGRPVDLDILMPGAQPAPPVSAPGAAEEMEGVQAADAVLPMPVVVTLFYSQAAFDRLAILETQLIMLHFDRASGIWTTLSNGSAGTAGSMNWLATPPTAQDGIYAIGWTR